MFEAKSQLSKLVELVESGAEAEIVIARNGKPAARLVPVEEKPEKRRLGLWDGKFPSMSLEDFEADNELIREMFEDGPLFPDEQK